jgi:LPXTG-site transpeptidase (sortase) family protein
MKILGKFWVVLFALIFVFFIFKPNNVFASATLTLQDTVINNHGGTAVATDWTLNTQLGSPNISGVMGSPTVTNASVNAGTYFLSENWNFLGYSISDWSCSNGITATYNFITLNDGQSTVCTVTMDDVRPILHLRNIVNNNNGGTATATDWTLSATGSLGSPTNLSGTTSVDSGSDFKADTYLLHASGPANYIDSSWNCVPEPDPDSSITLQLGENVTCTITHNDVVAPQLTVTEFVIGGNKSISDFPIFIDGSSVISGNLNTSSIGLHTISETPDSSYTSVIGGDCALDGTITLIPGDVKNCTITNTYITPVTVYHSSGGYYHPVISSISPPIPVVVPIVTVRTTPIVPKFPRTGFPPDFFSRINSFFFSKNSDQNNLTASVVEATIINEPEKTNTPPLPIRLKIPKIKIDASIEQVGILGDETMGVPGSYNNVAWFNLGPRPGEEGSSVIDGHSGLKNNKLAVFDNLYKLKKGDKIYVENGKDKDVVFIVRESQKYDFTADATDAFVSNDGKSHLNLITCAGVWNPVLMTHSKRLVVFTDKEIKQ